MSDPEPKAAKRYDILNGTISLTGVLSLLSAVVIGVWTCANTLNDIRAQVGDSKRDLTEAKTEIDNKLDSHATQIQLLSTKTDTLWEQNRDTHYTLIQIQDQIKKQGQ